MNYQKENTIAAILAGGKSSRMGTDKGLILWKGIPFVEHLLTLIQPLVSEAIILANDTAYLKFGTKVVSDTIKNKGPIGGMCTAFDEYPDKDVLFLSCDVPNITEKFIVGILDQQKRADIIVSRTGDQLNPFPGLYASASKDVFKEQLMSSRLSVIEAIELINHIAIPAEDLDANYSLLNINTKEDLNSLPS